MAKKTDKNQLKLNLRIKDTRIPKLFGVLIIFLAIYTGIACLSYLFSWKQDQDVVLRFSWNLLFISDEPIANWLGRLGAIVSNMLIYWGFGLASFILVYISWLIGNGMLRGNNPQIYWTKTRELLFIMMVASVFLEVINWYADFYLGGTFGNIIVVWLQKFIGNIGLVLLFASILIGIIIWKADPDFNKMTLSDIISLAKERTTEFLTGDYYKRKQREKAQRELLARTATTTESKPKPKEEPALTLNQQLALQIPPDPTREKVSGIRPGEAALEITVPEELPVETPVYNPDIVREEPQSLETVQLENPDMSEPYDPTLELSTYEYPVAQLLKDYSDQKVEIDRAELEANKDQIIETLLHYKIEIVKIKATIGPTVTLYEIVPAPGVRISKIKNLEDDIALSLAALGIRIIAPIPGKGTIGIEVPNKNKQMVSMKEVILSEKFKMAKMDLPIAFGKTISNEVMVVDLAKMPHLLMAGATGQGKSVGINTILASLLYKKHPSQLKLVMVDPKKVELSPYAKLINHFLAFLPGQEEPITTETNRVIHTLNSLCLEMDTRYNLLKKAGVRNIKEYNEKFIERKLNPYNGHVFLPFIVLIIDEFADLIMTAGKEIELPIGRLAQLSRAVGIHLVIATQRPSVNIITGVIKANFPARIAFKVSSKIDSRTILDAGGADQLIGRGDMLLSVGGDMVRLQCAFIDTPEVEELVKFIGNQRGYPEPYYLPEYNGDDVGMEGGNGGSLRFEDLDEMFEDAAKLIVQTQHGSTSMIQRRMKLGYNRAGRIMDQLESMGVVGAADGSKPREVLIFDELELERYITTLKNK